MSGTLENKILNLQERLRAEKESMERDRGITDVPVGTINQVQPSSSAPMSSPIVRRPQRLGDMGTPTRPRRQLDLPVSHMMPPKPLDSEVESKMQEIMKMNGILNINGMRYQTEMKDLEHLGELGMGTCGHVVKMKHKPSGVVIAVKQMRRSGNTEENKRIIMDLDVVLKSHDCPYIVQCLGCFITESDVWICMELMATCLDKLLKRLRQSIPEDFLGKVTVATVKALSYLKEKHGVIHRDVKPSNILLDEMGGVKLCDFGISGRLVDSKAKTRSAGCAAYMAPERIDPPDPTKPDYDIRADVWSLGITLVELATGVFPYKDCNTDFEVLSRVVQDDPPVLPLDAHFSKEFRNFVNSCLTKNYKHRPKYPKLMEHPFIKRYDTHPGENANGLSMSGCQWFDSVMRQIEPSFRSSDRRTGHVSLKTTAHLRNQSDTTGLSKKTTKEPQNSTTTYNRAPENGIYVPYSPYAMRRREMISRPFSPPMSTREDTRSFSPYRQHIEGNRCSTNGSDSRPYSPYFGRFEERESSNDRWGSAPRSLSPFTRDYSPWRRENVDPPGVVQPLETGRYSPFVQPKQYHPPPKTHPPAHEIYASPMISRKRFPSEPPPPTTYGNTSPQLFISRFTNQTKQENNTTVASQTPPPPSKESAKKRFASYVRLRLGGDRSASPEPPPRLSRGESPLAMRRNLPEQASPSFPRRYVSPSPPQPPPRRLSESISVPGSPQYLRARLLYTPEPQRKPPPT